MPLKSLLTFNESKTPVAERVTKFGGQPVWLDGPQWPMHRESGDPLMFVCQIKITKKHFPDCKANMAYLFIDESGEQTEDPRFGASEVVLQSLYANTWFPTALPTDHLESGPSLFRLVDGEREPCEFNVDLHDGEDAPYAYTEEPSGEIVQDLPDNWESLADENKIGGTPYFFQEAHEFDHMLLQIRGNDPDLPFRLPICMGWVLMLGNRAGLYWQAD